MKEKFGGPNTDNMKRVKLKVEIFDDETCLAEGFSQTIYDTGKYAFDILDISAQKCCSDGGRKVILISKFNLDRKNVLPVFRLFNQEDKNIDFEQKSCIILQPDQLQIQKEQRTVTFLTPKQNPETLKIIENQNWTIKLAFVRNINGSRVFSATQFVFRYIEHDSEHCDFCDSLPDSFELPKLDKRVERAGPKRKVRKLAQNFAMHATQESPEDIRDLISDDEGPEIDEISVVKMKITQIERIEECNVRAEGRPQNWSTDAEEDTDEEKQSDSNFDMLVASVDKATNSDANILRAQTENDIVQLLQWLCFFAVVFGILFYSQNLTTSQLFVLGLILTSTIYVMKITLD